MNINVNEISYEFQWIKILNIQLEKQPDEHDEPHEKTEEFFFPYLF